MRTEQKKFFEHLCEIFKQKDMPTVEQLTQWGWNLKVNGSLQMDCIDLETDKVRIRYTGTEFQVTMIDAETFDAAFNIIRNLIYTTILLGSNSMTQEERQELLFKFTTLESDLRAQYFKQKSAYENMMQTIKDNKWILDEMPKSQYKFPNPFETATASPTLNHPTYNFNSVDVEEAGKLIKTVLENGKGNIVINFAENKKKD